MASTVRFRVDRKDDGVIVICEAQNQALPSGHIKQTQYVLDVQCKCPGAGSRRAGRSPRQRWTPGGLQPRVVALTATLPSHFCLQTPPRPGSMPRRLW